MAIEPVVNDRLNDSVAEKQDRTNASQQLENQKKTHDPLRQMQFSWSGLWQQLSFTLRWQSTEESASLIEKKDA